MTGNCMNESSHRGADRGRRQFLLVVALFAVPLLAAVAWYALAPGIAPTPSVHGSLIDPAKPLKEFELPAPVGQNGAFTLEDLRGRWSLVHVIDDHCDETCVERLYFTRQIRTALGSDRQRVQRIALAREGVGTPGLQPLLDEHPRLRIVTMTDTRALRSQLPDDLPGGTVLLVDPLGNLMLRFGPGVQPEGILEDLEKLLKLSRVG